MIVKMTHSNRDDYNKPNDDGFTVIGRIVPTYKNDTWSYTEERFDEPYFKQYEEEEFDNCYIEDEDKAVFFYYGEDSCVGQMKICSNWNGFALIEHIQVAAAWRHKGIGTALLKTAVEWAMQNNCAGLMLETQDVNIQACRLYAKYGFVIGAVDNMMYANFATAKERAIIWYYKFSR
ncbi:MULTISPECIES: GNAT family N-acetyltransferase [Paenibacillus]|uniref:GNAT family N-acetyltransferase n=1 Tax=Paenibacillus alvei TaxID=44250 RepID=A0ABT4EDG2_PAEAL|nr:MULTISPECIES: GNAT family N-acetyltransferase [Paenibacillus]EPY13450.1 streptothricin acetyltransferase [Paenibacillus alvei A6-6i-x]MCY9531776.1 GNAT family N-acetyltransferase [Paenibacillus alvei]SDG06288.1 Acetyltransferase (GNAT) family protein [Paenibacillus sp. cl6col]